MCYNYNVFPFRCGQEGSKWPEFVTLWKTSPAVRCFRCVLINTDYIIIYYIIIFDISLWPSGKAPPPSGAPAAWFVVWLSINFIIILYSYTIYYSKGKPFYGCSSSVPLSSGGRCDAALHSGLIILLYTVINYRVYDTKIPNMIPIIWYMIPNIWCKSLRLRRRFAAAPWWLCRGFNLVASGLYIF